MVQGRFLAGLLTVILGPVIVRIYAELIIVMFKMNDGIQRIANKPKALNLLKH